MFDSLSSLLDRALDRSVLFSFDRTGFERHRAAFDERDLEVDLVGRTMLVTGANSGIGKEVTRELARRGARVLMVCRNVGRGNAARDDLMADGRVAAAGGELDVLECDVSDFDSIDSFVANLPVESIDVLIHNAGVLLSDREFSAQGLEMTLAAHLAGPLRMTAMLADRLAESSRIVWVSSGGMYTKRLSLDRLQKTSGPFDGVDTYADVKRAQVVMSEMLAERLHSREIQSHAMHPGWAATPGVASSIPRFHRATKSILRTPAQGADTVVWLACCKELGAPSGTFWFDRAATSTHMMKSTVESAQERERLWNAAHAWAQLEDAFI